MVKKPSLTVEKLIEHFANQEGEYAFKVHSRHHLLSRQITDVSINRPGMNLFGYFDHFAYQRPQIMGKGESSYIIKLARENKLDTLKKMFNFEIPCFIFSSGFEPPERFIKLCEKKKIPVLSTSLDTSHLIAEMKDILLKIVAPVETVHGVMMEIFGMGVLIQGKRGVGKSEFALELLERGHRFIADDVVDVRLMENKTLMASSSGLIAHHMEIKGLGIINVAFLFGVRAILNEKKIDLIIKLESHSSKKKYDRLGIAEKYKKVLGQDYPQITIPIQPGTNAPILIETATMNHRLKLMGYNPAKEFNKKLMSMIEKGEKIY
ncbi:MAG TPA: HPr(Ser) kinase/phosphatase [Spirochaetota bacterium]|nr:HPr(Ser) kinase/phosphatase [Spirochaetota bacterium]